MEGGTSLCKRQLYLFFNSTLNSFPVTGQNEFCFSSEDKAELLNKYFTSISTVNDENVELPAFEYKCQNRLSSITCIAHEVATLIELLNPNKATGPDGISNKMLKAAAKGKAPEYTF